MSTEEAQNFLITYGPYITGGLGGALLTLSVQSYRARVQPVTKFVRQHLFIKKDFDISFLKTDISISDGQHSINFENLYVFDIFIKNSGNIDHKEFVFGVEFKDGAGKIIFVEFATKDRHHDINCNVEVSPKSLKNELDFTVAPFNRSDAYNLRIYAITESVELDVNSVILTTKHAVKFTDFINVSSRTKRILFMALLFSYPAFIKRSLEKYVDEDSYKKYFGNLPVPQNKFAKAKYDIHKILLGQNKSLRNKSFFELFKPEDYVTELIKSNNIFEYVELTKGELSFVAFPEKENERTESHTSSEGGFTKIQVNEDRKDSFMKQFTLLKDLANKELKEKNIELNSFLDYFR